MSTAKNRRSRKRRWMQFSLRGLLALILVSAFAALWLRAKIDQARQERAVIQELGTTASISVIYDDERYGTYDPDAPPRRSYAWLRGLLGDELFNKPAVLSLPASQFNEETALLIGQLESLRALHLPGTTGVVDPDAFAFLSGMHALEELRCDQQGLTEAHFAVLQQFSRLKVLRIGHGEYSAAAIQNLAKNCPHLEEFVINGGTFGPQAQQGLANLSALRRLEMRYCSFADQDFSALEKLPLEEVDFSHSNVRDDSLKHVGKITTLQRLTLGYTPTTDAGLEHLKQLPNLRSIDLAYTRVTDAGCSDLARLTAVEELALIACLRVTDDGVAKLATLPKLRLLELNGTNVSAEARASLANSGVQFSATQSGLQGQRGLADFVQLMQAAQRQAQTTEPSSAADQ